jgi:hypothetical protein
VRELASAPPPVDAERRTSDAEVLLRGRYPYAELEMSVIVKQSAAVNY